MNVTPRFDHEKDFIVGRFYRLPVSTGMSRINIPCEVMKVTKRKLHVRYVMKHIDGSLSFMCESRWVRRTSDGCHEVYSPQIWTYILPVRSDVSGIEKPTELWEQCEREESKATCAKN